MSTLKSLIKSLKLMERRLPLYLLAIFMMTALNALFTRLAIEEAIRLQGESPACIIVLNSQRGEIIDIVCICRMLRDT